MTESPTMAEMDISEVSLFDLLKSFQTVLDRADRRRPPVPPVIVHDEVTIAERMVDIRRLVSAGETVAFANLFPSDASRFFLVVTFLALLELVRLGEVRARQKELFGPLVLVSAVRRHALGNPVAG